MKKVSGKEKSQNSLIDLRNYKPKSFKFGSEINKEGFLDISEKSVEELEEIRVELINKCMFRESKMVNSQKEIAKKQENDRQANIYFYFFEFSVQQAKDTYNENFNNIQNKYLDAEVKIRKNISDTFHKMQVSHLKSLIESEKEFIIRNTKLSMKSPKASKDLMKRANVSAKIGDLRSAQSLMDKATEEQEKTRHENKEKVCSDFMKVRKAMLKHQKMEIQELTLKLNSKLSFMFNQMNDEISRLNVVYIKELGFAQSNAKKNAIQKAPNKKVRDKALEMISNGYKEEIREFSYQSEAKNSQKIE